MTREHVQTALRELRAMLNRTLGPEIELTHFGSTVRGDYGSASDVDLLVLLPFEPAIADEERIFDLAYDVELKYGVVFGIIVYSKAFWDSELARVMPLHKNIDREGVGV